jgi:hypothetical protein
LPSFLSVLRSRLTYVRSGFLQLTLDLASFLSVLIGVLCVLHMSDVVLNLRDVGLALGDVIAIPPGVFDFRLKVENYELPVDVNGKGGEG